MTMNYTETLRQGAATTRRRGVQSAEALLKLIYESTEDNEERLERWAQRVKKNSAFLDEVLEYTFKNWMQNIKYGLRQSEGPAPAPTPEQRAIEKQESDFRVERIKATVAKVIIANFICPNGKVLRECTFGYVRKLGGAMGRLSAHGKPNEIIGDRLDDKRIQQIYSAK